MQSSGNALAFWGMVGFMILLFVGWVVALRRAFDRREWGWVWAIAMTALAAYVYLARDALQRNRGPSL